MKPSGAQLVATNQLQSLLLSKLQLASVPAVAFWAADLPEVASSAIELGWPLGLGLPVVVPAVLPAVEPPPVPAVLPAAVPTLAGESCVVRAEAGGALVLTGRSDAVRSPPAAPHSMCCSHRQIRRSLMPGSVLAMLITLTVSYNGAVLYASMHAPIIVF